MSYIDFRGAKGGGGGSSSSATYTPDTLRSADNFEVILGLCEGPIDACETFYIGDTPLSNADGSLNFKDFILNFYRGDEVPAYTITPYLGGVASSKTVSTTLMQNLPVVRTTTSGNINYIDIRLAFSALYRQTSKGTFTASATFKIEYKPTSSTTWLPAFGTTGEMTLTDKTTSTYVKEVRFAVPAIEDDTYDIRVTKTSQENDTEYFCTVGWESFQQVVSKSYKWAGTAIAQLKGLASNQFSSLPEFSGVYRLRRVRVPTNYDPVARTYTGTWDGTFKIAWSDNPAWCLYDFVTDNRFGMAAYYPIYLDKYSVYDAARWCDEIVGDGTPRYTMNMLVADGRTLREQAQYMAGVFNGIFLDDQNGTAYLRVDKDDDALHLFTPENTVGDFAYSTTDVTTRYNDITVAFTNEDQSWIEDRRRIYDADDIEKNGRITYDFVAVGCTNASQAVRTARYKLITALTETLSVTFTTNRLGSQVLPWEIILVSDDTLGYALSGRLVALDAARKVLTLRDPVYLEAGIAYTISFDHAGSLIERTLVSPRSGYNTTLTVDSALPADLPEFCVFSIQGEGVGAPKPFRVIKVTEKEGDPDNYEIYAIEVNRNKWNDVDNYTDSGEIEYSGLVSPMVVPGPAYCDFSEGFSRTERAFFLVVNPTFDREAYPYYSQEFEVWSRPQGSPDGFMKRDLTSGDTLVNHPPGAYEFRILGKSVLGGKSEIASVASFYFTVTNAADPPGDVEYALVNGDLLTWGLSDEPLDFAGFEVRYQFGGDSDWDSAFQAHEGTLLAAPPFNLGYMPRKADGLLVKAVDYFGNYSENPAYVHLNIGDPILGNIIETWDHKALEWPGTVSGGIVDYKGDLATSDVAGATFYSSSSSTKMYSSNLSNLFYRTPQQALSYIFSLEAEAKGRLTTEYTTNFNVASRFYYKTSASDTFWAPLPRETYVEAGEYFLKLDLPAGNVKTEVTALTVIFDVEDVRESFEDLVVPSAGIRLPITKTYSKIKTVNCTLQYDGGSGYTVKIMDKDPSLGPRVVVLNSSGAQTSGLIDATIEGYNA